MAKLTSKQRKALPPDEFAGPDDSYPIPDKSHAANAKARSTQAVKSGKMSKKQKAAIDAKANKKLGKGKGKAKAKTSSKTPPKKPGTQAQNMQSVLAAANEAMGGS